MSINTYLDNLASSLVLSDAEKRGIATSLTSLSSKIDNYFSGVSGKAVFGSYARHTILPRNVDENSDVDIMIIFDNPENHKPQAFLNRIKSFVNQSYSRSEIYQDNPTIVLELSRIKFELIPAYYAYGTINIPDGPSDWRYTNPYEYDKMLNECNQENGYKIKPIIRLIKFWNIKKNYRFYASFEIERKIAEELRFARYSCSSYTDYLTRAFEEIKKLPSMTNTRIDTALNHIEKAQMYESMAHDYDAECEIKKVFI